MKGTVVFDGSISEPHPEWGKQGCVLVPTLVSLCSINYLLFNSLQCKSISLSTTLIQFMINGECSFLKSLLKLKFKSVLIAKLTCGLLNLKLT